MEAPCLMDLLCEKHDGLVVEAKTIKEHWWKPHIKRLFERKVSCRAWHSDCTVVVVVFSPQLTAVLFSCKVTAVLFSQ